MQSPNPNSETQLDELGSTAAKVGECALLKAINVTPAGTFMEWRVGKDLLVPVSQQRTSMEAGKSYVVYLFLDPQQHVVGSTKLYRFLDERAKNMAAGEQVDLLIVDETTLGYKAVVNGTHLGLLYKDEALRSLNPGDKTTGYIKTIRADRKIDLGLQRQGKRARDELTDRILTFLRDHEGSSSLTDYSSPEAIYQQFGVSKGNYKKALGALYKQRLISVTETNIKLLT